MSPRQTRATARAQDAAAAAERQLAATELRRMGLRVPTVKTTPATPRQVGPPSGGWLLFGVEPEEQPQQASHLVEGVTVPWFLDESVRVLVSHASTEGILRKSGSLARQRLLKVSLESSGSLHGASAVLWSAPVHDVSGLFKEWLQLLPERLLPAPLLQLLLSCHRRHGVEAVLLGVRLLPDARLSCLRHLLAGLARLREAPLSRMDARNLATVLAPTLCALPPSATREDVASVVSLVEALICSAHLVGSAALPPPGPGREGGRKKTNSACVLLNQLRRLVAQRKAPSEDTAGEGSPPAVAHKRTKPRELLPRGLSPWKRAKRGEDVQPSQQQQPSPPPADEPREVRDAVPLPVEDACCTGPEKRVAVASTVSEVAAAPSCVAHLEEGADEAQPQQPEPMRRGGGGSCAAPFAGSSLRRGRPNSLRSGLPSAPRSARPGTKRHSSTGSKPRPAKGKENLRSSFRDAVSELDCPFNAHAMAHIAALRERRNAASSATIGQPLPEAPSTPLPSLPERGVDVTAGEPFAITGGSCASTQEPGAAEDEPMDIGVDADEPPAPPSDLQTTPATPALFALPAPPSNHRRKQEQAPTPPVWTDGLFALPLSPPGIGGGAGTKRESIIQIRERNAGIVRNNVEVFNRAAAANTAKAPPQRVRRVASAQSKAYASNRVPLQEANFQCPASPPKPRDWEMEL